MPNYINKIIPKKQNIISGYNWQFGERVLERINHSKKMKGQLSQKLLLGMEPSAVKINDAIALYNFLEDLREYEGSRLLWMDVTMNHKEKKFDSITFTSFDFNDERERGHVLGSAAANTALVTLFNSFYLLYQQRCKKDRQSFTPSYWMQILDEKYGVFA